ncbi:hypothetical protein Hanom_Chr07g00650851 [Helianthus anomalus]
MKLGFGETGSDSFPPCFRKRLEYLNLSNIDCNQQKKNREIHASEMSLFLLVLKHPRDLVNDNLDIMTNNEIRNCPTCIINN